MLHILKTIVQKLANLFGYQITKISDPIIDSEFEDIYRKCKDYTATSKERMYALFKAVEYIVKSKIPGDFVECGVWKGGSVMVIAHTLIKHNEINRKIYLYDTFEGMSEPTKEDVSVDGKSAYIYWKKLQISLDEVKKNVFSTGYPKENLIFIKGKVEDTIPKTIPKKISILRLDTDWYESTYHELSHLFPLIVNKGVLIIDDYGYWTGSKKAVDKYFINRSLLLNRIDYTGRIGIKMDD